MEEQRKTRILPIAGGNQYLGDLLFKKPFPKQLFCGHNLIRHSFVFRNIPNKLQNQRNFSLYSHSQFKLHFQILPVFSSSRFLREYVPEWPAF